MVLTQWVPGGIQHGEVVILVPHVRLGRAKCVAVHLRDPAFVAALADGVVAGEVPCLQPRVRSLVLNELQECNAATGIHLNTVAVIAHCRTLAVLLDLMICILSLDMADIHGCILAVQGI